MMISTPAIPTTSPREAAAVALIAPQTAILHSVMDGLSSADPAAATVADVVSSVDVDAFTSGLAAASEGALAVAPEYQPLSQGVHQAGVAVAALLTAAKADTSPAEQGLGVLLEALGTQFEFMNKASWVIDPIGSPTA